MNTRFLLSALTGAVLAGCSIQPGPDALLPVNAARARSGGEPVPVSPRSIADESAMDSAAKGLGVHRPATPAVAETGKPEGVADITVTAPFTFAGTWKITTPTKISGGTGGPAKYDDVRQAVCRFEQSYDKLTGACVPFRKRMRGSLNGAKLSLDWNKGVISAHIDGIMLSETDFSGTMSVGMLGANIPTDIPAYGVKLLNGEKSPAGIDEIAGKVMTDLTDDNFPQERYSASVLAKLSTNSPLPRSDLVALGKQTALSFVTQAMIPATDEQTETTMYVYDVEFTNGWRLCGLIFNPANKVDDVDCR